MVKSMRFKLLSIILLCLHAGLVSADEWTGVEVEFADLESDWMFDDEVREADTKSISFRIEGSTGTGLAVGGGIGYLTTRVEQGSASNSWHFDAQYLELYLRQDLPVGESFSLTGGLNWRYYTGDDEDDVEGRADIDWTETSIHLGVGFRHANIRITPYIAYYDVDGDIDDDTGTDSFELDDPFVPGVRFDIFTEATAFVRIEAQSGDYSGGRISFLRRY